MTNDNQLLEIAIEAAIKAGEKILEIYASAEYGIKTKDDLSPLTLADTAAHNIIAEYLTPLGFPILSEEGKAISWETRKKWIKFWLVDPLDGTKEFIKKNGEFTVNIALIEKSNPVLGVIIVPVTGELYYADRNGSFKCNIDLNKIPEVDFIRKTSTQLPFSCNNSDFVVVGSRSHSNPETEEYIHSRDTDGKNLKIITKGSSLKLCLVATGEADIYPRLGPTMEWDIAAGHAISIFAGRTVTQISSGNPIVYNKENLLNPWFVVK